MRRWPVREPALWTCRVPIREIERDRSLVVTALERLRPARVLPVWLRYLLTLAIVLVFFAARSVLPDLQGAPFLLFSPAIVISAFVFDRGSGFVATFFSAALALYFFMPSQNVSALQHFGKLISLTVFVCVGVFTASIIEALRNTIDALLAHETVLGNSLGLLETVIDGTADPIFVKDRQGRFVRVNSALARIFGVSPEAMRGRRDRDFLPETQAASIEAADRKVVETGAPLVVEELVNVAGQGERYFLSTKTPWQNRKGEIVGLIGVAQDIDDRKKAELELRAANAQKEILLHDINHRVKNHLQSVMSLLALSKRRIVDPLANVEIANAVSRLGVLARVYDRLQVKASSNIATVSIRDYLQGLCDEIAPALTGLRPIVVRTQLEDADLEVGNAVALGLAVNELVQNSFKYAFPEDRAGVINVRFGRSGPDSFVLEVSDDGAGMTPGLIPTGTGTRLVRALAQQLAGTVAWQGPPGYSCGANLA